MASLIAARQSVVYLLKKAEATGAGQAFTPESRHCTFDIEISNTATARLEVSWDGETWRILPGTTVTATTQVSIAEWYPHIRANCTAYTSGTVSVAMAVAPGE